LRNAALATDVGGLLLPGLTGLGMAVRGGRAAKAAVEAASLGDEMVDAGQAVAKAAGHADDVADAVRTAAQGGAAAGNAASGIAEEHAERAARGGTYRLIDPATGETQYVGRTENLAQRQIQHRTDPIKQKLRFEVDWRTDDYAVQRGREQMLYEQYRPPLNRIRPISPRNPRRQEYLDAARRFEEMMQ